MPDDMDRMQAANEDHVSDSLKRHRAMATLRRPGLTHCENLDCREPIPEARTRLGARLCDDCENDEQIRRAQFARGRV